jgi:hypothetical protein
MDGADREGVDGLCRRQQPTIASVACHRAYNFGLEFFRGKRPRSTTRTGKVNVVGMVSGAHQKEQAVLPGEPVE